MWMEVTGIPGSGKSSLCHLLRQALHDQGVLTHSPVSALAGTAVDRLLRWDFLRNRLLERSGGTTAASSSTAWLTARRLAATVAVDHRELHRLIRAIARQRNALALLPHLRHPLILDEGPRHLALQLATRAAANHLRLTEPALPWPDHLIVVRTTVPTALDRLLTRGRLPYPDRPRMQLETLLQTTEETLDSLLHTPPIHTHLWIVRNDSLPTDLARTAQHLSRQLASVLHRPVSAASELVSRVIVPHSL